MVYSSKFVMAVLVHGVPQRELANGVVPIPFGAEYSLRFRNKNNRRAVVKFFIDGENVSGEGYVVNANSHVDIKRHASIDRTFKFISLESLEAIDFGKNGGNTDKVKGVIEARFFLEKEAPTPVHIHNHYHSILPGYPSPPVRRPPVYPYRHPDQWLGTNNTKGMNSDESLESLTVGFEKSLGFNATASTAESKSVTQSRSAVPELQDGCTVEGHASGQTFHTTQIEYETDYVALKVFLQGFEPHTLPVTQVPVAVIIEPNLSFNDKLGSLSDLEKQNAEMRQKIAELENEKLRKQLEALQS